MVDKYPERKTVLYASGCGQGGRGTRRLQASARSFGRTLLVSTSDRYHAPPSSGVDRLHAHERRLPVLVVAAAMVLQTRVALEVFEVRVVAGLLGRDAAGGVVDEHHLEKIQARLVQIRAELRGGVAHPLGEGSLEVGIAGHAGPNVLGRSAKETVENVSFAIFRSSS